MLRNILGVIAGVALCNFGFMALAMSLMQVWPAYAQHGRTYMRQRLFTFPPTMAASTLLLWMLAASGAGFVAMKVAHSWRAMQVLAAVILAYAAAIHLIFEWARFPWWYNVAVVVQMGPAILLGARSAQDPQLRF